MEDPTSLDPAIRPRRHGSGAASRGRPEDGATSLRHGAPAGGASKGVPSGNVKVTREDWLRVALDALISGGIGEVKVLSLSRRLKVSRSSFYWYFGNRQDLLDALLAHWDDTNTRAIVEHASRDRPTIVASVVEVFRAWVDPALFDPRLDFAVREWSRRSGSVRRVIDRADEARLAALAAMYVRHGYDGAEADARARILYFMQIGYYALELSEPMEVRLARAPGYLLGFTGATPTEEEVASLAAAVRKAVPT